MIKNRKPKTEYNVSPEKFIETWQMADSAQEAADKLKMPKQIVLARASKYREMGIRLKRMKRVRLQPLNIDRMNEVVMEANKKKGLPPPEESTFSKQDVKSLEKKEVADIIKQVISALHSK